ncbi:FtsK/SpoIIIE domain-containing protein [Demequina globuliformis]|uniref:FtsK/SpoIIIE domain-containing protein n=1 Tax=Demequina globuliformis TaxID=676202 RepID=UPI0007809746|nr:FtsK/SpoIIIE domain-containing protein [Demequina globuliformis]
MRVTDPHGHDWEVEPGTPIAELCAAWSVARLWCGDVALTDDHPTGVPPVLEGAALTLRPGPLTATPLGARVEVVRGADAGAIASLHAPVTVGSGAEATLRVADPTVSRLHARLEPGVPPRLTDLGSTNGIGTRVRKVRRWPQNGAVRLGNSWLAVSGAPSEEPVDHSRRMAVPWPALVGGLASGAVIAVITGRWYLALIGLALPAAMMLTRLVQRARAARPGEDVPALPSGPLAIRGPREAAAGYARAVMLDRGSRLPGWNEPWMRWLPDTAAEDVVVLRPGETAPSWCTTVVDVTATGCREAGPHGAVDTPPLMVNEDRADAAARRAAGERGRDELPSEVRWAQVAGAALDPAAHAAGSPRSMQVALGQSATGPVVIDLDHHGPHLLVAGTTGSGKSVLLETLVAGLAHAHAPADLHLALMDFKGGAGLRTCLHLPHVAATVTDLDEEQARRALAGLAQEVASRKHTLAAHGHSSLADWERAGGAPARLLVVIDEYQEITLRMRTFVPELARIAAQGRSLGLHLVLATQRPSGAVTPEVRANIGSTIALRVASETESRDLIGSSAAGSLPRNSPGRAILSGPEGETTFQTAAPLASAAARIRRCDDHGSPGQSLPAAVAARWQTHEPATPLWQPPLPSQVRIQPDGERIVIALRDDPARRVQDHVTWTPEDGALVIVGAARTGRTSALRAIAQQSHVAGRVPVWLPAHPRLAARTLALAASRPEVLLLIDRADAALPRLSHVDDGQAHEALMDRLSLGLPTAIAGTPSLPSRLHPRAAVVAVLEGTDPQQGALWGVPRGGLSTPGGGPRPGRAWVTDASGAGTAQLASAPASIECRGRDLVTDLPATVATGVWAIGGDRPRERDRPTTATLVGPDGPLRQAIANSIGTGATTVDVAALAPHSGLVILTEPRSRDVRMVARGATGGLVDDAAPAGRIVMIDDGNACAAQLGVDVVGHLLDRVHDHRSTGHDSRDNGAHRDHGRGAEHQHR